MYLASQGMTFAFCQYKYVLIIIYNYFQAPIKVREDVFLGLTQKKSKNIYYRYLNSYLGVNEKMFFNVKKYCLFFSIHCFSACLFKALPPKKPSLL